MKGEIIRYPKGCEDLAKHIGSLLSRVDNLERLASLERTEKEIPLWSKGKLFKGHTVAARALTYIEQPHFKPDVDTIEAWHEWLVGALEHIAELQERLGP